jgi:hypothetical protein
LCLELMGAGNENLKNCYDVKAEQSRVPFILNNKKEREFDKV